MKDYTVTQDQFLSLGHYNRMFEHYSDMIMQICTKSYDDEISLGFELGKLHADMRDSYLSMMELLNDIRNGEESPKISLDQTFPWGTTTDDMVPYHTICGCTTCGCIMPNKMVRKGDSTITSTSTDTDYIIDPVNAFNTNEK